MPEVGGVFVRGVFDISNIRANAAAARAELATVGAGLGAGMAGFSAAMTQISSGLRNIGRTLTTHVTLPLIGLAVGAARTARDIDSAWNDVRKTYNATGDTIQEQQAHIEGLIAPHGQIGQAVTDLSRKYGLQRQEVIELAGELSAMGKTGDDLIGILSRGVEFAVAFDLESLHEGLELIIAVGNTFSLKTGPELDSVLRGLNQIENETAANGRDLAAGLTRAGGAAAGLVNDAFPAADAIATIAAAMGVFRERGQETFRSANALRAIFTRLFLERKGTTALWEDLEVAVANANGELKPVPQLLGEIAKNWGNLTQQEQITFAFKTIGIEFLPLFQLLVQDIGLAYDESADTQSRFMEGMALFQDEAAGAMKFQTELAVQQESLEATIGRVSAAWGRMIDVLTPVIREVLDPLIARFEGLIDRFADLEPRQQRFIVQALIAAAALGPLLIVLGMVAGALSLLATGPGLVVVGTFAALAAIGIVIYRNWETIGPLFEKLKEHLGPTLERIRDLVQEIGPRLVPILQVLGATIGALAVGAIVLLVGALEELLVAINLILIPLEWLANQIIEKFGQVVDWIEEGGLQQAIDDVKEWFESIPQAVEDAITRMEEAVERGIDRVVQWFRSLPEKVETFLLDTLPYALGYVAGVAFRAFAFWFVGLPKKIGEWIEAAGRRVIEDAPAFADKLKQLAEAGLIAFGEWVAKLPGRIKEWLDKKDKKVAENRQAFRDALARLARGGLDGFIDGIKALPGEIGRILTRGLARIRQKWDDAFAAMKRFGSSLVEGFKAGAGMSSPSFIERAMFAMSDTVDSETQAMARSLGELQSLARSVPGVSRTVLPLFDYASLVPDLADRVPVGVGAADVVQAVEVDDDGGRGDVIEELNIYYPEPSPVEEALPDVMRKLAYVRGR